MFKMRYAAMVAATLALGACQTGGDAPSAASSPTATEISAEQLIGKKLVAENGTTFLFNPDGTVGGVLGGETIVGAYTITGNETCSTYTSPARLTGREYCSTPVRDGDVVIFNRRDGSQSQPYRIEG